MTSPIDETEKMSNDSNNRRDFSFKETERGEKDDQIIQGDIKLTKFIEKVVNFIQQGIDNLEPPEIFDKNSIPVNKDALKLELVHYTKNVEDYTKNIRKYKDLIAPFTVLIAFFTPLTTSEFRNIPLFTSDYFIPDFMCKAFYIFGVIASLVWLIIVLIQKFKKPKFKKPNIDQLIEDIRTKKNKIYEDE